MGLLQSSCRFILLPGFVGLVCCGCGSAQNATIGLALNESNDDLAAQSAIAEQSVESEVAVKPAAADKGPGGAVSVTTASSSSAASAAAYREAINLASGAYHLSQSAISPDDWGLISSRWQRAADLLKKVTEGDENYSVAQQKMAKYSRNAEQAMAELQALQQSIQTPLPVRRQVVLPQAPSVPNARSSHSATASPAGGARIPVVRRLHGTPVVRVTFNGAKSYDMILDTGASRTLITRQMADELGIVETERMLAATASAAEVSFGLGRVRSISMGQVTLQNARVGIGDAVDIGLLGNDFLSGYDVTIRDRDNVVELVAAE